MSSGIIYPLYSTLIKAHLNYCVQPCDLQFEKDVDTLEWIQIKAIKLEVWKASSMKKD